METNVKKWYIESFPTDDMGEEINGDITFRDVHIALKNHEEFYDFISAHDSVIRERIFDKLSMLLNVDYDDIYDLWLE